MRGLARLMGLCAGLALASCATPTELPPRGDYLFAWTKDADSAQSDFLAVIDVDRKSPTFATVVATASTGEKNGGSHHTEHQMPAGGVLFANGFRSGRTWLFDLNQPRSPKIVGSFADAGAMTHAHSFERLANGNVLATYQMTGHDNAAPGGLAEISAAGKILRMSPVTGLDPGEFVRPYSLAIVPALDRVVSTSAPMHGKETAKTVQIWRLSDLKLLASVPLLPGPRGTEHLNPNEPRLLSDGRTVLVGTSHCGLYKLDNLASDLPSARLVHSFGTGRCWLPVTAGRHWVHTDTALPGLVSLDISDPDQPRVVDQLKLGADEWPHWISLAPDGRRIVIGGTDGPLATRLLIATINHRTGKLSLDETFRPAGANRPGVDFNRISWPHGDSGPAIPHGAVFSR